MSLDENRVVVISSVNVDAALTWCKEDCPSYITMSSQCGHYDIYDNHLTYDFFFGDEKEALLCRLKWT